MQQINQLKSLIINFNAKHNMKRWCLDYIEKKNCRLTYGEMKDLDFVIDAENCFKKDIELNQMQIDLLIKKYYHNYVIGGNKERIAEIVLGLPCSGKSTYLKNKKYVICDSDLIKQLIPEYDGGRGNERCHKVSKIIFKELVKNLAIDGYSLGIPIIGKTIKSFDEIYNVLVDNGYKIVIKYLKITKIEALNRALVRFIKSDRYVSLDYINQINEYDIENVYDEIINYSEVICYSKVHID